MAPVEGWFSSLFLGELQPFRQSQLAALPDLETRLESMFEAGGTEFPDVHLEAADFMRHIAAIVDDADDVAEHALDALHAIDLYLACACMHGDTEAIATFEREYISTLKAPLRSTGLDAHSTDDVIQRLREQLLVGGDDVPGIATYRGRGQLRSWLRAVAVRQAMRHFRDRRETHTGDDALANMADLGGDQQLGPWKQQYAAAFRQAFTESIMELSDHDRVLLRQHYLDQLTIDALAKLHKVHRSNAARWVAAARAALLDGVRERMRKQLAIGASELDSALRLARSQLDVSIHRLLGGKRQRKT
jgi:RNA polymerase sigma-70 factor, ECF subfamily